MLAYFPFRGIKTPLVKQKQQKSAQFQWNFHCNPYNSSRCAKFVTENMHNYGIVGVYLQTRPSFTRFYNIFTHSRQYLCSSFFHKDSHRAVRRNGRRYKCRPNYPFCINNFRVKSPNLLIVSGSVCLGGISSVLASIKSGIFGRYNSHDTSESCCMIFLWFSWFAQILAVSRWFIIYWPRRLISNFWFKSPLT